MSGWQFEEGYSYITTDVAVANLSVEYDAGTHWIAQLAAGGSPSSMIDTAMPVKAINSRGNPIAGDAELASTTSSVPSESDRFDHEL